VCEFWRREGESGIEVEVEGKGGKPFLDTSMTTFVYVSKRVIPHRARRV
jgi:hypothetical protein